MNKKEIAKLLSGRETKSIEDRLKKARRKKNRKYYFQIIYERFFFS